MSFLKEKPLKKTTNPNFCSGPSAKYQGWRLSNISADYISRSHRSIEGVAFVNSILERTRRILNIPNTHHIVLTPASATGAITIAMLNFLGSRPLGIIQNDVFSERWAQDARSLGIEVLSHVSALGQTHNTKTIQSEEDVLFVWNGTSTGTTIGNMDWLASDHKGLILCDATSSAFCTPLPWEKLDITCFSLQKGIGGEGGCGMLVVNDRALEFLELYTPKWPVPYIFNLKSNGAIRRELFEGVTINTPSLMCLSDYALTLDWAESGGANFLFNRTIENFSILERWIENTKGVRFFVESPLHRSPSVSCFQFLKDGRPLTREEHDNIAIKLAKLDVAYDIKGFSSLPPMLRVWTGPTIEAEDLKLLTQWFDWAYDEALQ